MAPDIRFTTRVGRKQMSSFGVRFYKSKETGGRQKGAGANENPLITKSQLKFGTNPVRINAKLARALNRCRRLKQQAVESGCQIADAVWLAQNSDIGGRRVE